MLIIKTPQKQLLKALIIVLLCFIFACAPKSHLTTQEVIRDVRILNKEKNNQVILQTKTVLASHYCYSLAGRPTASGEIYDPKIDKAAQPKLPFGTIVYLKNPQTNKEISVRINDRGPFIAGREIDISNSAAKKLGFNGLAKLEMNIIK